MKPPLPFGFSARDDFLAFFRLFRFFRLPLLLLEEESLDDEDLEPELMLLDLLCFLVRRLLRACLLFDLDFDLLFEAELLDASLFLSFPLSLSLSFSLSRL